MELSMKKLTLGSLSAFCFIAIATNVCVAQPPKPEIDINHNVMAATDAANNVGFEIYDRLRLEAGNIVFSPASIGTSLAMIYGGTAGETEQELAQILHFDNPGRLPKEGINEAFGTITKLLNSDGKS